MGNREPSRRAAAPVHPFSKREVVILLAEDDDGHAELIISSLRDAGVLNEVVRFTNGEKVLNFFFGNDSSAAARTENPYLLLLDIRMPRCDGITVLKQLKKDERLRKIPIVVLTSTDDPAEIERCYALGCSAYVTKPLRFGDFAERLRKLGMFLSIVELSKP